MYFEIPSLLLQIISESAVTVVATNEVVPCEATILAIAGQGSFSAFHHIVAARAVNVHVEKTWGSDIVRCMNFFRTSRERHATSWTDGFDHAIANENASVGNFYCWGKGPANVQQRGSHG